MATEKGTTGGGTKMKSRMILRWTGVAMAILTGAISQAMDLQGTIANTVILTEDSQLVGDVTCTMQGADCIKIGGPNVRLALNGFTMSGQGNPPNGCLAGGPPANLERGIEVTGQNKVEITGPGVIQHFRGWGIFLAPGTTQARVSHVTFNSNCLSGIQISGGSDNDVEDNISVRNGNPEAGCGGICFTSSNNNRVRRNITGGNGYAVMNVVNFGIALEGTASGNLIERNIIVGNVNGIYVQAAAANNVIRRNNIMGNPPIQIPVSIGDYLGFDIRNFAPAGANTFTNNLCSTYSGDTGSDPAPCPSVW